MSAPIYTDELWQGASDPAVIRRDGSTEWWMFYTQRRALLEGAGVEWVHGSRIGVAVSVDGGASWQYRGVVDFGDGGGNTHWAPEVVRLDGTYHLYLTWIEGTPTEWAGHERHIVHFESDDLESWTRAGRVDVGSDFAIDAAVARTPDGRVRLWFKDEAAASTTWSAVSANGRSFTREQLAVGGRPHEGPNVFELGGAWWLVVDEWRGQAAYRGTDGLHWTRQPGLLLAEPGEHPLDRQVGRHADVVVTGPDTALIFYFTHPEWNGEELADATPLTARRTQIHVAQVTLDGGRLVATRDFPAVGHQFLPMD